MSGSYNNYDAIDVNASLPDSRSLNNATSK